MTSCDNKDNKQHWDQCNDAYGNSINGCRYTWPVVLVLAWLHLHSVLCHTAIHQADRSSSIGTHSSFSVHVCIVLYQERPEVDRNRHAGRSCAILSLYFL